jgi:hypothetical protein
LLMETQNGTATLEDGVEVSHKTKLCSLVFTQRS